MRAISCGFKSHRPHSLQEHFARFMHITVTGGAGFIGSHFIEDLLTRHPDISITNIDAFTYAGFWHTHETLHTQFPKRYHLVEGSVTEPALWNNILPHSDYVVHFAAESNVDLSLGDSQVFLDTNINGTHTLLEACQRHPVRRILLVSTDEVYGNAWKNRPSVESDPLMPCSPYAASKAAQDMLAYSYYVSFGLPVVRTRCSNNYGPRQDPTKLIPRFARCALAQARLPLYGHGQNTRDWIHVLDHVRALEMCLLGPESLNGDVFNVGANVEKSAQEVGEAILKHLNKPLSLLEQVPDRQGHVERHAVNSEHLQKTLGWEPSISWEQGLSDTLNWYQENTRWLEKTLTAQRQKIPHYAQKYGLNHGPKES